MSNVWDSVEPRVYESRIKVPYTWQAGETASRFLLALKNEKRFLGKKCSKCAKVLIPPRKSCPYCFVETGDWVDVHPADEAPLQLCRDQARRCGHGVGSSPR